jgi:transcriptional regulator with XRE-family HTH domain
MILITSEQIRMARAVLRWSMEDLASKSGVGASTIKRMETFKGTPKARVDNLQAIHNAFVATGRVRLDGNDGVFVVNGDAKDEANP